MGAKMYDCQYMTRYRCEILTEQIIFALLVQCLPGSTTHCGFLTNITLLVEFDEIFMSTRIDSLARRRLAWTHVIRRCRRLRPALCARARRRQARTERRRRRRRPHGSPFKTRPPTKGNAASVVVVVRTAQNAPFSMCTISPPPPLLGASSPVRA